jgi:chloramphenicol-sensitive protein RarD
MSDKKTGILSAFTANIICVLLPIYWKSLTGIHQAALLAWRVAGCSLLAGTVILLRRRNPVPLSKILFLRLFTASILIGLNWMIYLWAIEKGLMVEASLGYYINPLVNVLLGMIFFSEKLGKIRLTALILAFTGVLIITIESGVFPWLSIALALSFGLYGLVTKRFPPEMDSIEALAREMFFLGPFALIYLTYLGSNGSWHFFAYGSKETLLLIMAGSVTLLPLWLFGRGAKTLPLGVLGFLQYVAPTSMLLLGILIYREPFNPGKAVAFAFILIALGVYSTTLFPHKKK